VTFNLVLSRMESGEAKKWPGFTGKAYPEVFNTIPPQPQQLKSGQLSEQHVKKFFDGVRQHVCAFESLKVSFVFNVVNLEHSLEASLAHV